MAVLLLFLEHPAQYSDVVVEGLGMQTSPFLRGDIGVDVTSLYFLDRRVPKVRVQVVLDDLQLVGYLRGFVVNPSVVIHESF